MRSHSHWSKDSRFLYGGEKWQGKGNRLIRIEVATKKEEEIRKITEFITTGVISFVPFWTPDDEPIALKDLTSYQIYRIDRDR
jgi:hypothetical protein